MPNHFHLVIWPRNDGDLGRRMQWLLRLLTCHLRRRHVKNWAPSKLRFPAFNPGDEKISLELTIIHRRSTIYATRVVAPFVLQAGKNEIEFA